MQPFLSLSNLNNSQNSPYARTPYLNNAPVESEITGKQKTLRAELRGQSFRSAYPKSNWNLLYLLEF